MKKPRVTLVKKPATLERDMENGERHTVRGGHWVQERHGGKNICYSLEKKRRGGRESGKVQRKGSKKHVLCWVGNPPPVRKSKKDYPHFHGGKTKKKRGGDNEADLYLEALP